MSILVFAHEVATLVKQHQDAGVETQEIVHVLEEVVDVLVDLVQSSRDQIVKDALTNVVLGIKATLNVVDVDRQIGLMWAGK